MDWTQTFTIIGSMIGAVYAFYHITEKRIDKTDESIKRMETHHREDMHKMDEKLEKMDAKWERLFERLLLQDQQKGKM
jgi:hypothetical protein